MADKIITFTEPTTDDITEVVVVFEGGSVKRVDPFGTTEASDGTTVSIRTSVKAADLNPGQVTALEQILGHMIGNLIADNGF